MNDKLVYAGVVESRCRLQLNRALGELQTGINKREGIGHRDSQRSGNSLDVIDSRRLQLGEVLHDLTELIGRDAERYLIA